MPFFVILKIYCLDCILKDISHHLYFFFKSNEDCQYSIFNSIIFLILSPWLIGVGSDSFDSHNKKSDSTQDPLSRSIELHVTD